MNISNKFCSNILTKISRPSWNIISALWSMDKTYQNSNTDSMHTCFGRLFPPTNFHHLPISTPTPTKPKWSNYPSTCPWPTSPSNPNSPTERKKLRGLCPTSPKIRFQCQPTSRTDLAMKSTPPKQSNPNTILPVPENLSNKYSVDLSSIKWWKPHQKMRQAGWGEGLGLKLKGTAPFIRCSTKNTSYKSSYRFMSKV